MVCPKWFDLKLKSETQTHIAQSTYTHGVQCESGLGSLVDKQRGNHLVWRILVVRMVCKNALFMYLISVCSSLKWQDSGQSRFKSLGGSTACATVNLV